MLLRFNTFFTVTARPHAEADKKRVLHELAACVRLRAAAQRALRHLQPARAHEPQRADRHSGGTRRSGLGLGRQWYGAVCR